MFIDIAQQCFFTFTNYFTPQANFSLKMKVMGSNPGYLLILFSTLLTTIVMYVFVSKIVF